jgi:hypothetical protein
MGDIDQDQIINRTAATEIMADILIVEICAAIENNGDIIVDIFETIGMV